MAISGHSAKHIFISWTTTARENMLAIMKDAQTVQVAVEYLNKLRKAVGLQIDSETAVVEWTYAQTLDPYGDDPNLPEEFQQVGFAGECYRQPIRAAGIFYKLPHRANSDGSPCTCVRSGNGKHATTADHMRSSHRRYAG
jgi:hypothetical protein